MTIRARTLDAEVLLAAPRRSAGIPNQAGTHILYSQSTHLFDKQETVKEIRLLDPKKNQSIVISDSENVSEPRWLSNSTIALLETVKGATNIVVGNVDDFAATRYTAGTVDAAVSDWKLSANHGRHFKIAVAAPTSPDGSLYNEESAQKPTSSGRLYKSLMVRHWDKWTTPVKNSIWVGELTLGATTFKLHGLRNVLADGVLESPVPPFGGSSDFDINDKYLTFVAKSPHMNKATNTKQDVYIASLDGAPHPLIQIVVEGLVGAASNPILSPNGKWLSYVRMRRNGYESDKNQIVLYDLINGGQPHVYFATDDKVGAWDRSPGSLTWSPDSKNLLVTAADNGRVSIFAIPLNHLGLPGQDLPHRIFEGGAVSSMSFIDTGLFISSSSLIDNSTYLLLPTLDAKLPILVSSNSLGGGKYGLKPSQVGEISFPGAKAGTTVQAWVIKPSFFDKTKKYPLAYLIHGGPQGAWEDSWSTRWNPAVYAEQGYIVVTPNPTGSTGFGQAFTDAIQLQWGGLPYQDLVNGFDYIEKHLDYVDTSKAVALGASYGGYMAAWIQGNDLGRRFKAIVMHDGVFNIVAQMSTEELYFPYHEFGGVLWENMEEWQKWDPSSRTEHWSTPMLIIHSEKDFRLTVAEGLAAFNVLQTKGIESQFLTFPDENHWVLKPENSLLWHTAVLDFINSKVGIPLYSQQNSRAKALKEAAWSD